MTRMDELEKIIRRRKLDRVLVAGQANVRALTGVNCDNAILSVEVGRGGRPHVSLYTDFRYVPMVHRMASQLKVRDIRKLEARSEGGTVPRCRKGTVPCRRGTVPRCIRLGYELSISHGRFVTWQKLFKKATFVDVSKDLASLRAVKTPEEIAALREAETLNCEIWETASSRFTAGMTERQMARIIKSLMIEKGDGEAFDTIVCVGKNAAECHHEPDDTVWNGREPVLVDMGVKLNGVCSDLTRNLAPGFLEPSKPSKSPKRSKPSKLYRQVYSLVLEANRAAIAAAKPGITGRQLDKVARDIIRKGGFGKCFGHSLGHGVGYEIHETPSASKKGDMRLKPGMLVTIEPGIYLEGNLGVRIEDLVLITETGCEVLSNCEK